MCRCRVLQNWYFLFGEALAIPSADGDVSSEFYGGGCVPDGLRGESAFFAVDLGTICFGRGVYDAYSGSVWVRSAVFAQFVCPEALCPTNVAVNGVTVTDVDDAHLRFWSAPFAVCVRLTVAVRQEVATTLASGGSGSRCRPT